MPAIMEFLTRSIITSGVLLIFYWLFLRNKNLHTYNRFYLLGTVLVSLIVPFLHFEWYSFNAASNTTAIKLLNVISSDKGEKETFIKQASSISIYNIIQFIYATVCFAFLVVLVARIAWVYKMKTRAVITNREGYTLIQTNLSKAPFSFFNLLFWKEDIDIDSAAGQQILVHELVHIKQHHTLDKLFIQIVLVGLWVNPFYWLIQKELSMVHEFIADEAAIENRDTESFAVMLLRSHYGNIFPDIVHPFFYSPIKRRLIMLNQTNKTSYALMRRLMVLPLLAAVVFLFSFAKKDIHRLGKKIVLALDAGHGGQDNGAVGKDGSNEKDLTLKITKRLATLAPDYNIEAMQIRPDDKYVVLTSRAEIANKAGADVFMSIHINAADTNPGYELIFDDRNVKYSESVALSSSIINQLHAIYINPEIKNRHLFVLNQSNMPAVLVECGNIDNVKDIIMKNDAQLDGFCRNILAGVVDYENSVHK